MRQSVFAGCVLFLTVAFLLCSGCTSESSETTRQPVSSVGGVSLSPYTDTANSFSLQKPASWSVSVQDAIEVQDPADGGVTNVRIQPLFLSGSYRALTAGAIANYLVGKAVQYYEGFELVSARETTDRSMIEMVASFREGGVKKTGVYTVFVQSPYALLTSYETAEDRFSQQEDLLRAIASSFTPITPSDLTSSVASPSGGSALGPLQDTLQSGKVRMRIPNGWSVQVFPGCAGLVASAADNSRGVIFLNQIHSDLQTGLPPGVTPETYLTTYLPQDFTTVSNMRFLQYEDVDVSVLGGGGSTAVRAMRCSFANQGVPSTGSFTIGTRQIGGYYTTVDYLWGFYSTSDQFMADAPVLLDIFTSIDYSQSSLEQCRAVLSASWGGSASGGGSSGDELREQRLNDWYAKQDQEDIFLEKFSDYTLNQDRVFNPETNEVYHVDQNFYQYYDTHRDEFKQQNMVTLTEDQFLTHVPLDGTLHIEPNW
jgi:hypothetical protein